MGLGSFLSYLPFYNKIFGKTAMRVLILGLTGGGGKTTVLYKLKDKDKDSTAPGSWHTVGFNVETVDFNDKTFEMWDIGGGDKLIPLWKYYFPGTKAVIFVFDSTDRDNLDIVESQLTRLLYEKEIEKAPFLVLANMQDYPNAMSLEELKTALKLDNWKNRSIHLQAAVATKGTGLTEGMEWLCTELSNIGNEI